MRPALVGVRSTNISSHSNSNKRTMQIPKKKPRRMQKVLEIAADVGSLAMSLRDRPTRLDWVSLGLRAVSIGVKIQHNKRKQSSLCPWSYFEETGPNRANEYH